eukprot:190663-Amphidinium_carterae.2
MQVAQCCGVCVCAHESVQFASVLAEVMVGADTCNVDRCSTASTLCCHMYALHPPLHRSELPHVQFHSGIATH